MRRICLCLAIGAMMQVLWLPRVDAIVAIPAKTVTMPLITQDARCKWILSIPGGHSEGAAIPVPALRLGAQVRRSTVSFTTGGSGTANLAWRQQRQMAGLPYDPQPFDIKGSGQPWIYTEPRNDRFFAYQRLPLSPQRIAPAAETLVYAQATSKTAGRIAAVQMTLPSAPAASPRYRLTGSGPCRGEIIDIFSTNAVRISKAMLTSGRLCILKSQPGCASAYLLRGRILFVRKFSGAQYFEHRWVDFDMLSSSTAR